ncbi:hypothetical protein CYY_006642 [Polysphondylium violaceum]|uniref:Golgi apparatus membrane protein TVP23 homolog n=1 Tax=Polysphondylium violaceum TaxID=133409 RepID=A0A8J4PRL5_9MYCE|nr:hypothetical protein CYY_006642 [Polysphondylium violaceum]
MTSVNEFGFTDSSIDEGHVGIGMKSSFLSNENNNNSYNNNKRSPLSGLDHPIATLFHILFKVTALILYITKSFGSNFVMTFILCVLLLSFDFWTVKNITGRLMVGLRWWNQVNDDGTNSWYFESASPDQRPNPTESFIFWMALYFTPLVWLLFLILSLLSFSFNWSIITIIALSLSIANVYGYFKCSQDSSTSYATSFATKYIGQSLLQKAASKFL